MLFTVCIMNANKLDFMQACLSACHQACMYKLKDLRRYLSYCVDKTPECNLDSFPFS